MYYPTYRNATENTTMLDEILKQDKTNWSEEDWMAYAKELEPLVDILENIAAMQEQSQKAA